MQLNGYLGLDADFVFCLVFFQIQLLYALIVCAAHLHHQAIAAIVIVLHQLKLTPMSKGRHDIYMYNQTCMIMEKGIYIYIYIQGDYCVYFSNLPNLRLQTLAKHKE